MTPSVTVKNIGTRPEGHYSGTERWAQISWDDGTLTVTAYRGWDITDEVRLSGMVAVRGWGVTDEVRLSGTVAVSLAECIAHQLIGDFA